MSEKPSLSLILNSESGIINATAKEAFLPPTVSLSTDHGFHTGPGSSRDQRYPHGLQRRHRPQTSTQPSAAAQTPDIYSLYCLCFSWPSDLNSHVTGLLIFAQSSLRLLQLSAPTSSIFLSQTRSKGLRTTWSGLVQQP